MKLTFLTLLALPFLSLAAVTHTGIKSPALAGPIGPDCVKGSKHEGKPAGTNITIAGVHTYYSKPPKTTKGPKKVLLFLSDIYSPFYINNELLQDYFASQGFHVLGLDYLFGDGFFLYEHIPDFDVFKWIEETRKWENAREALPRWIEGVKKIHGPKAKYTAVGYCFGGPFAMEVAATDDVVAGAFAHPTSVTEDHFLQVKKPLLMSCAQSDFTFPLPSLYRSIDILSSRNATYHTQLFSGVTHGFATRGNLTNENELWAKQESAKSVVEWFNRFSK